MDATAEVRGARLRYRLEGDGPLLVLTGTPAGVDDFAGLAAALSVDHTVLSYDPRGTGASNGGLDLDSPDTRADDLAGLLDVLGIGPADVVGNSGGAMTGMALLSRAPEQVRTLIAHEPPVIALLPDAAALAAGIDEVVALRRSRGPAAAWGRFAVLAGYAPDGDGPVADDRDAAPDAGEPDPNGDYFLTAMLPMTSCYDPDLAALRAGRVVVAVGDASGPEQLPVRASRALAAALGAATATVPGDHGGFASHPQAFALRLRELLGR